MALSQGFTGALHADVALNKPEDWIAGIDFSDRVTALALVAEEFDGWAPELTALITDSETDPVPRPIYALPVEHRWDRVAANRDDFEAALVAYERELFPRSMSAAAESERNLKRFFDDHAPQSVVDLFTHYQSGK